MTTASRFFEYNRSDRKAVDEYGSPLEGQRLLKESLESGENVILRFHNGLLDGDVFDDNGNFVMQKPAVDAPGHQEYWRKNCLHRDGGEPAVYSQGFSLREWWENGERLPDREDA